MTLKYKRTHVPTGQTWIIEFKSSYKQLKHWVCDCADQIDTWNKQGIVNGQKMWQYDLIVEA
jgi:hypothetical protein